MNPTKFAKFFDRHSSEEDEEDNLVLELGDSNKRKQPIHTHRVELTRSEVASLKHGMEITKITEMAQGHDHTLVIRFNADKEVFEYIKCDANRKWRLCGCRHPRVMLKVANE